MLELGSKFLISYFLGSIMGSMLMGRLRGGVDIRTMGSGNAGGTNALRTQGLGFALGVMLVDVGKGALAAGLIPALSIPLVSVDPSVSRRWLTLSCAAAAVIGHVWPMWHNFRGGKGAATLLGTLVVLAPTLIIPVIIVWLIVLTTSGFVGLATMAGSVFAPVYLSITRWPEAQGLIIYCALMAGYMIFTHRSNIRRMRERTEPRNAKLMLFRRPER